MPTKSTTTISSEISTSGGFILLTPEKAKFIKYDEVPSTIKIWEDNDNEDRYTSLNKSFYDKHFKVNDKKIKSDHIIDLDIIAKTWDESISKNVSNTNDKILYLHNNKDILKTSCNKSLNFNNSEDVINQFKNKAVIKALEENDTIINKLREGFNGADDLKNGIVYTNKKNNITSQDLRSISSAMSITSKQLSKDLQYQLLESKEELTTKEHDFLESFLNNLIKKMENLGIYGK